MKEKLFFRISFKNIALMLFLIVLNSELFYFSRSFELPLWLDTIGTMAAAMELGPVAGIITGLCSSLIEWMMDATSLAYAIVPPVMAVIVGTLMPNDRRYEKLHIVSVALLAGLASTLMCIPLNLTIYDGKTGNTWGNALKAMLERDVSSPIFNSFASEAFIDLPDRVVSMFAALFILRVSKPVLDGKSKKTGKASKTIAGAAAFMLALSAFSAPTLRAEAQDFDADYETVTYGSKDGIFNSSANAVAQTPDGYLWVGTYSGLYSYDGIKFEETDLHESIKAVKELLVDSWGRLWIGTNDSGIVCYDTSVGSGTNYIYDTTNGLESDSIRAICEDAEGNIYIGTALSLTKLAAFGTVKTYYEWKDISHVQSLVPLDEGGIVGITNAGTLFLAKDDMLLDTAVCTAENTDFRVAAKWKDTIYVGTSTSTVEKFKVNGDKLEKCGEFDLGTLEYCNRLRPDAENGGLFCCCENGLGFIDCSTDAVTDMTVSGYNGAISDVCVDAQGNVWFASSKQGLMKYSRTPFKNLFRRAKLPEKVTNAVMKDGDRLYIGTDGGLFITDLKSDRIIETEATKLLQDERVRNIYKDSKGNIWVSTYGAHGLVRISSEGKAECISSDNEELSGMKFRSVTELSDGRILVATNMGLTFLKDGKPQISLTDTDGLFNQYILSMIEREDGAVLAASDGDGIYIIKNDKVSGHIGAEEGLKTAVILRIIKCTGGYLYVTSNGLYYDNDSYVKRLKNFPYYNNYDILISEDGTCYITSSAGLFIVSEEKLLEDGEYSCTMLNESWGLNTTFTANSWNVMEDGKLYLCCTDGVRMISAEDHITSDPDYQLHLKLIEADGAVLNKKDGKWIIPSDTRRLILNIAVNNFSLSNPRIHYYLEGSEDDGITCYQNEITPLSFTNLPYGQYELHICVLDDVTGEVLKEEVIPIEKQAVMYEFWYFKLYLMFIIIHLFMYIIWVFVTFNRRALRIRGLQREISTDPMTGLLNKAGSIKALEKACTEEVGVLMMIDLDSFKLVNDIYGHEMGDRILIRFAELITEALGEENIKGRMGGDEFVGFMKESTEEEIEKVTRFLNRELVISAKEYMGEDMNIPIGTSVGAVRAPADGQDFHELFKLADKALYVVKQNGKHGCSFYKNTSAYSSKDDPSAGDLSQIIKIIGERNEGKGAYSVNFDKMQVIYKYLCRNSKVNTSQAEIIRFYLGGAEEIPDEALDSFEDHLIVGLKKNDVVSRYSGSFFVLLNDISKEEAEKAAARLAEGWEKPEGCENITAGFELESIG